MELYEILSPDFRHADERGELVQLVQDGFVQVNVLKTKRNVSRGGHYHKLAQEAFYVISGSVEVTLSHDRRKGTRVFREGEFFLIPPLHTHSLYFPEDCVMVAMYDRRIIGEDGRKDIYPMEVQECER